MNAPTQIRREASLDALNPVEMAGEFVLIPWSNLRDKLDAEAEAMRARMRAGSEAYFDRQDRASGRVNHNIPGRE